MKRKTVLVASGAIGYLFGASPRHNWRGRLKTQATRLRKNPKVQQVSERAKALAKDKAPQVQQKLTEIARKPAETSRSAAHRPEPSPATPAPSADSFGASSSGGQGG